MPAGVQPVEQGRAAAANVKETGGRGCKAGDDGFAHCEPSTTVSGENVIAIDIEASAKSYGPRDMASSNV